MTSLSRGFFHAAVPTLSIDERRRAGIVGLYILLQASVVLKLAAQSQAGAVKQEEWTGLQANAVRTHAGIPVEPAAKPSRMAIIDMKASDTHLVDASTTSDGKINRWFVLQTASIGSQYRVSRTSKAGVVADQLRYQVTFKGAIQI
jgi:hypothetical protein